MSADDETTEPGRPWRDRAEQLAAWTMRVLVNRTDVWGGYLPREVRERKQRADGGWHVQKSVTKPPVAKRGQVVLAEQVLRAHYEGRSAGDVAGVHSTGADNLSRWFVIDIDQHEGEDAGGRNFAAAKFWHDKLVSLGFSPLLIDSNGRGGFHLWCIFDRPVPTADVFRFAQWLVKDFEAAGLAQRPETFPKQDRVEVGGAVEFGNWCRLPGRHHTAEHWSRVWDGESEWLDGAEAVAAVLVAVTNAPELIPPEALAVPPPPAPLEPVKRPPPRPGHMTDAEVALKCLDALKSDRADDYETWLKVGMILHTVDQGESMLAEWDRWSRTSGKYTDGECARKWKSFDTRGNVAKLGQLVRMAEADGCEVFPTRKPRETPPPASPTKSPPVAAPPSASGGGAGNADDPPAATSPGCEAGDDGDSPLKRVLAAIEAAKREKDAGPVFDAVSDLAALSPADYGRVRSQLQALKAKRKLQISTQDLARAVKAEQVKNRQRRRQTISKDERGLPEICCNGRQLRDVTRDSLQALVDGNDPPKLFMRAGSLVRLKVDENRRMVIGDVDESHLRGRLERSANYFTMAAAGDETVVPPPLEVVKDVLSLDLNEELRRLSLATVPPLDGVVESPVVRPDGSVLDVGGYDAATRLYYAPAPDFGKVNVPRRPAAGDVAAAVAVLDDLLADFPFEDEASAANARAALITPFVRPLLHNRVPLAMFDKPQPGTGGSLLAEAVGVIATGRQVPMWGAPKEDEEWRKLITTVLLTGAPVILVDNVERELESDSLARVITGAEWGDRILSVNRAVCLPSRAVWMVTGNNVALGRNLARRCYQVRLNARVARPELREGFRHPQLLRWVKSNRARLVSAVTTLVVAWWHAGRPKWKGRALGNFEDWCWVVGGILDVAGIEGFLGNLEEMRAAAEDETLQWTAFLLAWERKFGRNSVTISEVLQALPDTQDLREALPADLARMVKFQPGRGLYGGETYLVDPRLKIILGKALQKRSGMRFGLELLYVNRAGIHPHTKVATWQVLRGVAGSKTTPRSNSPQDNSSNHNRLPQSAGSAGSVSNPSAYRSEKENGENIFSSMGDGGENPPQLPALPAADSTEQPADPADWSEYELGGETGDG